MQFEYTEQDLFYIPFNHSYSINHRREHDTVENQKLKIRSSRDELQLSYADKKESMVLVSSDSFQVMEIERNGNTFLIPIHGTYIPFQDIDITNIDSNQEDSKLIQVKYKKETKEETSKRIGSYSHKLKILKNEPWSTYMISKFKQDSLMNFIYY